MDMKDLKFNDNLELSGDLLDEHDAILSAESDDHENIEPLTDEQIEELLKGMYEDE